jgi:hypothetical protein
VRKVTTSPAWKDNGLLVVTWDEGNGGDTSSITPNGVVEPTGGGGHVLTLVITRSLKRGTVLSRPLNHYGLLATIEANFHLAYLGQAKRWARHLLFSFSTG